MVGFIKLLMELVNNIHDILITIFDQLGFHLTDKDLHFWIVGVIGIVLFILTDQLFKWLADWNVSIISFIYTFTVLIVLVFSIEIEQKITKRGHMEFNDIVAGLWGFIAVFSVYVGIRLIVYIISKVFKSKEKNV
ncbi:hypothetical protein [Tepidibacillus fermentans]|uniref:Uncharacterized protein n=1 Tax=Tepidibacillus fermentans TaxID=1281767 RepID=A0A4R3KJA0_9BACI|nr:hypothetical protein [Tepidibacillus fermentans]TCS83345.1 hypothetical protein EDD72_10586 [Tepidibacillus fermentans]